MSATNLPYQIADSSTFILKPQITQLLLCGYPL